MSEVIINKKLSQRKYRKTNKGKACQKRYNQSEKGKLTARRYWQSEKGKATKKRQRQTEKYKLAIKRFWEKNKDKNAEYMRNYKIKHPNQIKARQVVNDATKKGDLPRPDTLQCSCGNHPAQEYHHHLGYEPEHWLDVIPVCRKCHRKIHS